MIWIEIKVYGIFMCIIGVSTAISSCQSSAFEEGYNTVEFCSDTTATSNDTIVLDAFSTSGTPGQCTCVGQMIFHENYTLYGVIISDLSASFYINPGCGTSLSYQTSSGNTSLKCGGAFDIYSKREDTFTVILNKTQPPFNSDYCIKTRLGFPGNLTLSCFSPYSTELPPIPTTNMMMTKREATIPATTATASAIETREATTVGNNDGTTLSLNSISEKVNILPSCQPCISSELSTGIVVLATLTAVEFIVIAVLVMYIVKLRYPNLKLFSPFKPRSHDYVNNTSVHNTNTMNMYETLERRNSDRHYDTVFTG